MLTWTPVIAAHAAAAAIAVPLGALALFTRRGSRLHRALGPRLHKALGYTWALLMLVTALTSLFIRDFGLPNIGGYTPIHILTGVTLVSLPAALWFAIKGQVQAHRMTMINLYVGACLIAGLFTLLPDRLIGRWLWGEVLVVDRGHIAFAQGVLAATPAWVFVLMVVLLAVGLAQWRDRQAGLARLLVFPVAMLVMSTVGLIQAFGVGIAFGVWLLVVAILGPVFGRLPMAGRPIWNAATRQFQVRGSAMPLLIIATVFSLKFAVGVTMAVHPAVAAEPGFAVAVATAYGAVNALLGARAVQLIRMAKAGSSADLGAADSRPLASSLVGSVAAMPSAASHRPSAQRA
jgi:uncharacterized membrane protein